ncbi:hypothetical protein EJ04DRAFT_297908 [Polyplosphaeria fusca]|uniref:Uncharacterized protein n=1 Tax=Polyplosphaeria fusca TaxID=682080 RepID=A0A9P4QY31_9PLEO|nr:hypothetical protein EJ04DRAFT_297908 [Polyplosphaeria fusca]
MPPPHLPSPSNKQRVNFPSGQSRQSHGRPGESRPISKPAAEHHAPLHSSHHLPHASKILTPITPTRQRHHAHRHRQRPSPQHRSAHSSHPGAASLGPAATLEHAPAPFARRRMKQGRGRWRSA